MINENDLAAAMLAKLASTELTNIDGYTETPASTGRANRLNPLAFIPQVKQQQEQKSKQQEQAIIEQLNREAESQFPILPPTAIPPHENSSKALESRIDGTEINKNLEQINDTLKGIKEVLVQLTKLLNEV